MTVNAPSTDTFVPRPRADIEADIQTALSVSANDRFIVRHVARDEPFYYLGDTAWELFHRLDLAEAELFLRNRAQKGFNSIMVVLFAEHGGLDFPNRAGEWPFHPAPESKPGAYVPDLMRPNPRYYDFVDQVVALASSLDMTISLVPTWGRYVNGGYYGSPILFNEENARAFGRFVGERYPFHPFILGGDSNRLWNPDFEKTLKSGGDIFKLPVIDFGAITEAMAQGLLEGEAAGIAALDAQLKAQASDYKTFITFHSAQGELSKPHNGTDNKQFGFPRAPRLLHRHSSPTPSGCRSIVCRPATTTGPSLALTRRRQSSWRPRCGTPSRHMTPSAKCTPLAAATGVPVLFWTWKLTMSLHT